MLLCVLSAADKYAINLRKLYRKKDLKVRSLWGNVCSVAVKCNQILHY